MKQLNVSAVMKRANKRIIKIGILTAICAIISYNSEAQDKLYGNAFSLNDVKVTGGIFKHAQDLNVEVLLKYDVDRLLAGYRKEAGLSSRAKIYPNWEGLDGHVGGHYLTALAMNYASTRNDECKKRMDYMVAELKLCMEANSKLCPDWAVGYMGAVPNGKELWPKVKAGDITSIWKYWVPWYNVHKMYAGLRDAWMYAGSTEARQLFLAFCDWAVNITSSLSDAQMESMLGSEHGGMNEVLADAYEMTKDTRYLAAAKRFSHREFLEPLSKNIDNLDNKHANTQVPKAVGFERIGELTQDNQYLRAGSFFWETVTGNRSLAFGGNSRREFFPSVPSYREYVNDVEGPESCNTYNMLKLSQGLFRLSPDAKYMDFYERALYNHIISTQHPQHGGYVYFTPARPRHYRVYSAPNEAMWCCVGSGMENHGKYGEQIYTHRGDSLFLNLFIASELNWKQKGIRFKQETSFPDEAATKLSVTSGSGKFVLMVRYPAWVEEGALKISVNGKPVSYQQKPSSYIAINRQWEKGDLVRVELPMRTTIEKMPNVPEYIAIMHGPLLLGARTETQNIKGLIADDGRWSHIAHGEKLPVNQAPVLVSDRIDDISQKLIPVKGKPLQFMFASSLNVVNDANVVLEPFFRIHDSRYMMYWMALTPVQYNNYMDSIAHAEKEKLELEKRTVDFVAPGEQQPEVDHQMQSERSRKGNAHNQAFREASGGGHFSYSLATNKQSDLALRVRYWGAEGGNRNFDIYIDDQKLITENLSNKWNRFDMVDVEYAIPASMLAGKDYVSVKFQASGANTAGPVYYLRLVKSKK